MARARLRPTCPFSASPESAPPGAQTASNPESSERPLFAPGPLPPPRASPGFGPPCPGGRLPPRPAGRGGADAWEGRVGNAGREPRSPAPPRSADWANASGAVISIAATSAAESSETGFMAYSRGSGSIAAHHGTGHRGFRQWPWVARRTAEVAGPSDRRATNSCQKCASSQVDLLIDRLGDAVGDPVFTGFPGAKPTTGGPDGPGVA
jgi:hypothetical protein